MTVQTPALFLITNRRGAGVAVVGKNAGQDPAFSSLPHLFSLLKNNKTEENGTLESICTDQIVFVRTLGKTAEGLWQVFCEALRLANCERKDVKTLVVGKGPGSFTGLRLGTSFANGFCLGAQTHLELFSIKTLLAPELFAFCQNFVPTDDVLAQLGEYSTEDESTGSVTFFDLIAGIHSFFQQSCPEPVRFLTPEYGREPGPVLKLRNKEIERLQEKGTQE